MKIKIISETHSHRDQLVPVGTILEVDEPTGRHLIGLGAADPAPETAKPTITEKES